MNRREQIELLEKLFRQFQPMMISFAHNYVRSGEDAKGIVQEVFMSVWNNREHLRLDGNLKSYLFTATKNKCLNFLEKRKLKTISLDTSAGDFAPESRIPANIPDSAEVMEAEELRAVIFDEIHKLPPKCREIFVFSREEGLSYKEISEKLGVSTKTVENQIGIALKRVRKRVESFQKAQQNGGNLSAGLIFTLFFTKYLIDLGGEGYFPV